MSEAVLPVRVPRRDAAAWTAAIGISAAMVLRVALLFHYRINGDETQHLHVAWGWANGLVQYRDLFDNHMPLFHLLAAPFVWLVGERPEILLLARMAMLPLFALTAWLTYRIACTAWSKREAAWAALLGCLVPEFFLCSLEFRTDDLWTVCWLACIALVVVWRRPAWAGFALGLAFAVSAKTLLLAIALGAAALVTHRKITKDALRFVTAMLIPPALIAAYFASRGAWTDFLRCTVTHNLIPSEHPHRFLYLIPSLAIIYAVARRLDAQRRFLFLAASFYGAALLSFWPILEAEHWLPFYPLIAVTFVPLIVGRMPRLAYAIVIIEALRILQLGTPWRDEVTPSQTMIADTARLTRPGESVIDLKGDLVFRRRATYAVFEKITKRAISLGQMQDTVAADVLRTHAMVAMPDNEGFPKAGRAFLQRNFVRLGALRVAGKFVHSATFTIEVPGEYAFVDAHGAITSLGYLAAGTHRVPIHGLVIWQRAVALGMSPIQRPSGLR